MKTRFLLVFCGSIALLAACKSNDNGSGPFAGGGGTNPVGVGSGDSGPATDDDGGIDVTVDAGPPTADTLSCTRVNPVNATNEDIPFDARASGVTVPMDLVITRQVARFDGNCIDPKIVIKLSDGHCPAGGGHEIVINISVNSLEDGELGIGENLLQAEPDNRGVSFRYTRPKRLATVASSAVGTWGTCSGSSGQIVFPDIPNLQHKAMLAGRFLLTLTPCMKEDILPVDLTGAFNVELPGLDKFCPGGAHDAGTLPDGG